MKSPVTQQRSEGDLIDQPIDTEPRSGRNNPVPRVSKVLYLVDKIPRLREDCGDRARLSPVRTLIEYTS